MKTKTHPRFPNTAKTTSFAFLLVALAAGCGKADGTAPTPVPSETQAIASAGDVMPKSIYAMPAPQGVVLERSSASMPGTPKMALAAPIRPSTVKFKEMLVVVPAGSAPSELTLPIDATEGSALYVGGKSTDAKELEETEKNVEVVAPDGLTRMNWRKARTTVQVVTDKSHLSLKAPTVVQSPAGLPTALKEEAKPLSAVHFDAKAPKGDYTMKIGAVAAKNGVSFDVRLPSSTIEMDVTPAANSFLLGEEGTIRVELLDVDTAIAGAAVEAELVRPDGTKAGIVPVREVAPGKYDALVTSGLQATSPSGVYNVMLRAKGTSKGVRFNRTGATAFEFVIPTAKVAATSAPRAIKDEAGQILALEVDVNLEVASLDRYEISGTLAAIDTDGTERPVALAQTAVGLDTGKHTMTLRFDAGYAKLTGLEGTFVLRGLQLYSQGRNALLQMHHRGLGIRFPAVRNFDLVPLKEITPAVQIMIDNGEFDLTKK